MPAAGMLAGYGILPYATEPFAHLDAPNAALHRRCMQVFPGGQAAVPIALPATGIEPEPLAATLAVVLGAVFLVTGAVLWRQRR